jgi:hypothetical protein
MKLIVFILGIVLLVVGLGITGWVWYRASQGQINEPLAYTGPVLLVLGGLRMLRAAVVVPLPAVGRLAIVGLAILAGYGNAAAIKAVYPNDQVLASSNH